ncbi:unnamed protein product [Caenorhabditis angaria]|uniref:DUF19 domain-containing protein n=1 Tax=Caenorhabditis angaria TaxID=860376 RepID=A0A9P1ILB4_9PELO|nr:unnamed protein product [Caenorhabditis angaria]
MHLSLLFLLFLAPTFCLACDPLKMIKCSTKLEEQENMPERTMIQKIDKRLKTCELWKECGEVMGKCNSLNKQEKRGADMLAGGCPIVSRLYQNDFIDCAIVLEKNVEKNGCRALQYRENFKNTGYKAMFDDCIDDVVKNGCTSDQQQIYDENRKMAIKFLDKFMLP